MTPSDETYAVKLLAMLKGDCMRLQQDDNWASVVAWTAQDARQAAAELTLPTELASRLRMEADAAVAQVKLSRAGSDAA